VHLLRNSFRYASKRDWAAIARGLKPVYTAASEADALDRFIEFSHAWGSKYPAIVRLWENAWAEFVPFLAFDREIRTVICTTNAIESLNSRYRRAVNARGHFPTEQAALKCLYLTTMALDPTGTGRKRWTSRWLSRPGARCRHCCRSVSPGRSPNRACASRRTRLSTAGAVRCGSVAGRGWGSVHPGSGNG
jgi:transposase-like protein